MPARLRRTLAITSLLAGTMAVTTGTAHGHATLARCSIAPQTTLRVLPKMLTCTFVEEVNPCGSFIGIFQATGDHAGMDAANSQVSFANAKQITLSMPKLAKGSYAVLWVTVSANDGHRAGGSFVFSLR